MFWSFIVLESVIHDHFDLGWRLDRYLLIALII